MQDLMWRLMDPAMIHILMRNKLDLQELGYTDHLNGRGLTPSSLNVDGQVQNRSTAQALVGRGYMGNEDNHYRPDEVTWPAVWWCYSTEPARLLGIARKQLLRIWTVRFGAGRLGREGRTLSTELQQHLMRARTGKYTGQHDLHGMAVKLSHLVARRTELWEEFQDKADRRVQLVLTPQSLKVLLVAQQLKGVRMKNAGY